MAKTGARDAMPTPEEQVRSLYGSAETQTAEAMEQLVASQGFGELLARMTENLVALSKVGSDVGDLVLRNLRIAGRGDIARLARQLNRTEDKLELLLQRIEELQDGLDRERDERAANGAAAKPGRAAPRKS
jgi:peptidoglycan hydrolase CwlO-like protein